ncbi:MAG: dihydrofolate reductase [Mycobacteriaceae bacterium]|nr:dihydrofolate reductase [Mycobacteriaceae bacterium]
MRLIWAQTPAGVIGKDNAIPWRLPEDMAHFKALTLGHPVIMGRRTWESLPAAARPLPDRHNIVVTRDPRWSAPGAAAAHSVDAALVLAGEREAWVIGGGRIYAAALPLASDVTVTEVDADIDGDAFAPPLAPPWRPVDDTGWRTSKTGLRYRIRRFELPE